MKNFSLAGWRGSLLFMAATTLAAHAAVVNNLPPTFTTSNTQNAGSAQAFGQEFTTGSGAQGTLTTLQVSLSFSTAASSTVTFSLYNTSGGLPTGTGTTLGSYTSTSTGSRTATVTLSNNPLLSASTEYAIIMTTYPTTATWNYTTTAGSGGTATMPLSIDVYNHGGSWQTETAGIAYQMDVDTSPVPESHFTGAFMAMGSLVIAGGSMLRRKMAAQS